MHSIKNGLYNHELLGTSYKEHKSLYTVIENSSLANSSLTETSSYESLSPVLYQIDSVVEDDPYQEASQITVKPEKNTSTRIKRRAEHNATERARRECLNNKFQCLAQELPNLTTYRRPSKSQIVDRALDWVRQSAIREQHYRFQILQLQRENKHLAEGYSICEQQNQCNFTLGTNPNLCKNSISNGRPSPDCLFQISPFTTNEELINEDISAKVNINSSIYDDGIDNYPPFFNENFLGHSRTQSMPTFLDYSFYNKEKY